MRLNARQSKPSSTYRPFLTYLDVSRESLRAHSITPVQYNLNRITPVMWREVVEEYALSHREVECVVAESEELMI